MDTTGSRSLISRHRLAVQVFCLVGLAAAFLMVQAVYFGGTASAATFTVNDKGDASDDDIGDGTCATAGGVCTLRAAIEEINALGQTANTINFNNAVFAPGNLTPISLTMELDPIEVALTINGKDRTVIIDGGGAVDYGLAVIRTGGAGSDDNRAFTLNGGGDFRIRDIIDTGIAICGGDPLDPASPAFPECDDFIMGATSISGVRISDAIDGIRAATGTFGGTGFSVLGSNISTGPAGFFGVVVDLGNGGMLGDKAINIGAVGNGNTISGTETGVAFFLNGDINSKVGVNVVGNASITGDNQDGIVLEYAGDIGAGSALNVNVTNNTVIEGSTDQGVQVLINASDGADPGSGGSVTTNVNDNGTITGGTEGVEVSSRICDTPCVGGDTNSSTVNVNGNTSIAATAGGHGVLINSIAGSDDSNTSTVNVNDNGTITGSGGTALEIDSTGGGSATGDGNTSTVNVTGNTTIMGDIDGVDITSTASEDDNNSSSVDVYGNTTIEGTGGSGVTVNSGAGNGATSDENNSTVHVSDNGTVTGGGASAVNVDSNVGDDDDNTSTVEVNGNGTMTGLTNGVTVVGDVGFGAGNDGNTSSVNVDGNTGDIEGTGGHGVSITNEAAGGVNNTTNTSVSGNVGDITGGVDDGIHIEADASGGATATNNVDVNDNTGVISGGGNGLELALSTTVNVVDVLDNSGNIFGTGLVGLFIGPLAGDFTDMTATIAGNTVGTKTDGSGLSGIFLCCGDFSGSVVSHNNIAGNSEAGIALNGFIGHAAGVQVGPDNVITQNGLAGVVVLDDDSDRNTITRNSTFENGGLGIDLQNDGAGCGTAGGANECLPPPTINSKVGGKIFGEAELFNTDPCVGCIVEVFKADVDDEEGETFLVSGITDASGLFAIQGCGVDMGDNIVATLTDTDGNTSEFSGPFLVPADQPACATATPTTTNTPTVTATSTASATPTVTNTPTITSTPEATATPAATETAAATATAAATVTATPQPTATNTAVPTATNTAVPTATNTPVPTVTNTPVSQKICGDVNMDGLVNSVDAALVLQLEAGRITSLTNMRNGDVNRTNSINSIDAALILQRVAGLIQQSQLNCFPLN